VGEFGRRHTLQALVAGLRSRRGNDKTLFLKKHIKNIKYSPSQIKISLFVSTCSGNAFLNPSVLKDSNKKEKTRLGFSPFLHEPKVRNLNFGSASRDNSNCFEIILPNTIHGIKKKNL